MGLGRPGGRLLHLVVLPDLALKDGGGLAAKFSYRYLRMKDRGETRHPMGA